MKQLSYIIITLLTMLGVSMSAFADDSEAGISIENVTYQYKMFTNESGILDCTGTLEILARIPTDSDVDAVILDRSPSHHTPEYHIPGVIFLGLRRIIEIEPGQSHVITTIDDVSWGMYFRMYVRYKDGHSVNTDTYVSDSYIKPQDLEDIKKSAGVEDVNDGGVSIAASDRVLSFCSAAPVFLRVFDLQGSPLYSGMSDGPSSIPVNVPFIIVQYEWNGKTVTKKIRVK